MVNIEIITSTGNTNDIVRDDASLRQFVLSKYPALSNATIQANSEIIDRDDITAGECAIDGNVTVTVLKRLSNAKEN